MDGLNGVALPLESFRLVEGSAFVAAPSGGMTLAQLGADVIRFDQIGGGLDSRRWPLTAEGRSIYWAGLNKGKRSIAVDLRSPEAREVLTDLIAGAGSFLTNFPARGWLEYDVLSKARPDLVMLAITGNRDGTTALDYTVNCAIGYPMATGPATTSDVINHVLPAWDLICGQTASLGLVAADRHRLIHGVGSSMSLALSDVALSAVSALGHVAEAQINGTERPRLGNDLYGAYGADFVTVDGIRIYVVGISPKQWSSLLGTTGSIAAVTEIEHRMGLDFSDEGDRFRARSEISDAIRPWIESRPIDAVAEVFDSAGVCWGRYQSFLEMVDNDPRCSTDSGLFRSVAQPGIGTYLTPGSPLAFGGEIPVEPLPAPQLGEHTDEILASELGLTPQEIGRLHDSGTVSGPNRD